MAAPSSPTFWKNISKEIWTWLLNRLILYISVTWVPCRPQGFVSGDWPLPWLWKLPKRAGCSEPKPGFPPVQVRIKTEGNKNVMGWRSSLSHSPPLNMRIKSCSIEFSKDKLGYKENELRRKRFWWVLCQNKSELEVPKVEHQGMSQEPNNGSTWVQAQGSHCHRPTPQGHPPLEFLLYLLTGQASALLCCITMTRTENQISNCILPSAHCAKKALTLPHSVFFPRLWVLEP
jgi:hypothetical protein